MVANVDEDDCCWAIVIGVDGRTGVWKSELGAVGSDVVTWIGVCRIIESSGPSTIVDGEDGVLGFLLLTRRFVGGIVMGIGRRSLLRLVRVVWLVAKKVRVQGFLVDWG